jgi:hypothetical protein
VAKVTQSVSKIPATVKKGGIALEKVGTAAV